MAPPIHRPRTWATMCFRSGLLSRIGFPLYFPRELFNAPRLWIGPRGTVTPQHRRVRQPVAQVWGRKSFILAAPHCRDALGTWSTTPQGGLEASGRVAGAVVFRHFWIRDGRRPG